MFISKKYLTACATSLLLTSFISTAEAWDATGHIIIAQIAYNNLTPIAQQDVDTLIQKTDFSADFPNFTPFVYSAPWPDYLNYDVKAPSNNAKDIFLFLRNETKTWHFVDDPIIAGNYQPAPYSNSNAIWAVNYLIPNLSILLQQKNYNLAAYDLIFLIHIVGDMHQPLHNAELYDADFPNGDIGGNLYKVTSTFGANELHAVWDDSLGQFSNWPNHSDNAGYRPPLAEIQKTATAFQTLCPDDKATNVNPADWEKESHQIATNVVYPMNNPNAPKIGDALSSNYITQGQAVADSQMCLAGKRLATILNAIFTTPININQ